MKFKIKKTPRNFTPLKGIDLKDCGKIFLNNDEQITFQFDSNSSNDIVKKNWGFYLTNSINKTLLKNNFRTALVFSKNYNRLFINIVHKKKIIEFKKYLKIQNSEVILWLDKYDTKSKKKIK